MDSLRRYWASDGSPAPFSESMPKIIINTGAFDRFESGNGSGGEGFGGAWSFSGGASVTKADVPRAGHYHLRLSGKDSVATRATRSTGAAHTRLNFDWKAKGFAADDTCVVEAHNGSTWVTLFKATVARADDEYHSALVDLLPHKLPDGFQIRARSLTAGGEFCIDNLAVKYDARAIDGNEFSNEQARLHHAAWGLAADGQRVWVSNYRLNRIEVYDCNTGEKLGQHPLAKPLGIAVESADSKSGTVWIANSSDRVTRLKYDGAFTAGPTIDGLADPCGVAIGGSNGHLFVSEMGVGHGHIHQYSISGKPALAGLKTLGSQHKGGPLAEDQLYFNHWAGIAVDKDGILSVMDDHRLQRFHTEGASAGKLQQSWTGLFAPSIVDTSGYGSNGRHIVALDRFEFEVEPEYTGGPREGWAGDGTWRMVARYYPSPGLDNWTAKRLKIRDKQNQVDRELIFTVDSRSIYVMVLEPSGARKAAWVGALWRGKDLMMRPKEWSYNWTDTNGNGQVDWDAGNPNPTNGEIVSHEPIGLHGGPTIDDEGNIWNVDSQGTIFKIPLEGFDAKGNPLYNWANRVAVAPVIRDGKNFWPLVVKVTSQGDFWAIGMTTERVGGGGVNGGDWIAHYDRNGNRLSLVPTLEDTYAAVAFNETEPDGGLYFTAGEVWAFLWTTDGLLIAKFRTGYKSGKSDGWMDHGGSIGGFTHPVTGVMYAYGEDCVWGKATRWRLDNLKTIGRQEGRFRWDVPRTPKGHWQFQNSLEDSADQHAGKAVGGSLKYETGTAGQAVALDGKSCVAIRYEANPTTYTLAAWIKPIESGSANIISRGSSSNPNAIFCGIRVNDFGRLEHYGNFGGRGEIIAGSSRIVPGSWTHVAAVASYNGMMRLYVNGREEGTACVVGTPLAGGDLFHIGGPGGRHFNGLVDDVRVYETALTASEIKDLCGGTAVVSVVPAVRTVAEAGGNQGSFVIRRTGTSGDLKVDFTVSGTAAAGSDYTAIGASAVIPAGKSSVAIAIKPINDSALDPSESVIVTLAAGSGYVVGSPGSALVTIADDEADEPAGWAGLGNVGPNATANENGNHFAWSRDTHHANGAAGEVGGTIARVLTKTYYADVRLGHSLSLNEPIQASGKLTVFGQNNADGQWILGHMASDPLDNSLVGIEFMEENDGSVRWRTLVAWPAQDMARGNDHLSLPNGDYNFEYNYDPCGASGRGRLSVRIFGGSYDKTATVDLDATTRDSGVMVDAFGMGTLNRAGSNPSASKSIKMYIDDFIYSGQQPAKTTAATAKDAK